MHLCGGKKSRPRLRYNNRSLCFCDILSCISLLRRESGCVAAAAALNAKAARDISCFLYVCECVCGLGHLHIPANKLFSKLLETVSTRVSPSLSFFFFLKKTQFQTCLDLWSLGSNFKVRIQGSKHHRWVFSFLSTFKDGINIEVLLQTGTGWKSLTISKA